MRLAVTALACTLTFAAQTAAQQPSQTKPPVKPPVKTQTTAKPQSAKPAGMTNDDVIQMVTAGLSEQVIVGAIQHAAARNFYLSVNGLVALKKATVPDSIIQFMQTGEVSAPVARTGAAPRMVDAASPNTTPASAAVPPAVSSEDGVYYVDGDSLKRIEAKTPYQTRTGSTAVARLTFGIKKNRLNAMLPGLSAEIQVGQSPKFFIHVAESESVGEYYLLRFTVKQTQGRRELEVASAGLGKAQAGFAEKDIFLIDTKRMDKDIYLVTPKVGLSPGEYSLLVVPQATGSGQTGLTPRKIFDFSVR